MFFALYLAENPTLKPTYCNYAKLDMTKIEVRSPLQKAIEITDICTYFFRKTDTALVTADWSTSLTVTPGIWKNEKTFN